MPSCAQVVARTLAEAGITRMFGVPGGETLDLLEAARHAGIDFVLTHDENMAAFMADATGQLTGLPGVSVSTLGPGAMNMVLGVANAYLDRSPVLAITATLPTTIAPYATHQNLDLSRIYAAFTKETVTLDGHDTALAVRKAIRCAREARPGPVHIALPGDVSAAEDSCTVDPSSVSLEPEPPPFPDPKALRSVADAIRASRRPVVILGLDLSPYRDLAAVRRFVDALGVPVFVAPKAKGAIDERHPLFCGVCAGVAADHVVLELFGRADLLVGIGYDPVESNRIWHHTMRLVSVGPQSIAAGRYRPYREATGDITALLELLLGMGPWQFDWPDATPAEFRAKLDATLRGDRRSSSGLSPVEVTRRLRRRLPPDTLATTDVGSVKFVVSQAWTVRQPGCLLQSNGLSAMGFAFPGAMAARLQFPERPVLCMVGDGGFAMCLSEIETSVRRNLDFLTVVFNDSQLSLIDVLQRNRGLPAHGVRYGRIDFAAAAEAFGACGRQVTSLEDLDDAIDEGLAARRLAVIDVQVDPTEYQSHTRPA